MHYDLGPSSFTRGYACSGSIALSKVVSVEEKNEEASVGTLLHKALAEESEFDSIAADLSDWHLEALQRAGMFKKQLLEAYPKKDGFELHSERFLNLSFIHESIGGGTADLIIVKPFEFAIFADWKFFFQSKLAPAPENDQMKLYALGIAREFDVPLVKGFLFMPHLNAQSEAEWNAESLEYLENSYRLKAQQIKTAPMYFQLGDHCKYCRAKALCPAQITLALSTDPEKPLDIPGAQLADFMDKGEKIEGWYDSLKQFSYQRLLQNPNALDGRYGLFEGRNKRTWNKEDKELEKELGGAAKRLGKKAADFWTIPKIKSPAQLETTWGKSKKVQDELNKLIETKAGALVMRKVMEKEGSKDATA